ncbi:ribosome small subunit-dependent GTPase A [Gulosibacter sp. 10]|uniref:ribosome small subunit-dependent GTPase A n=1 Tax=Gulosibacter sp. 10 TaxID=1255570 RepID=UPI00097F69DF|nr:ribosome small subunit-dependent GTPase A [Gulosibacter sp. 10]SJM57478.1 Ribosome small subunit-stimulated GTPase EngC [Gulosibacter sp. 10]
MSWERTEAYDRYDRFSEDDVRVRANRRGSRPRTKQRPDHEDAVEGFVLTVDRGRYTCLVDEGRRKRERTVLAATARELGRKSVVVGDRVSLVGDVSGEPGSLARIVRIAERDTLLRRSADDSDRVERIIVANADQLCVVVAAARPEPRPRLIDRYLVAAYDAGIEPFVVITKTDLARADAIRELVAPLDVPVFETALDVPPPAELRSQLSEHITVMVGHSGVGKSTLVNALVPKAGRATGRVNAVTGRGRHTSSSSLALRVEDAQGANGWIIDTPGVRSFGLGHVDSEAVFTAFPGLARIVAECPRGCTHRADAPDCELDAAMESGELDAVGAARVASLRRLLASMEAGEDTAA